MAIWKRMRVEDFIFGQGSIVDIGWVLPWPQRCQIWLQIVPTGTKWDTWVFWDQFSEHWAKIFWKLLKKCLLSRFRAKNSENRNIKKFHRGNLSQFMPIWQNSSPKLTSLPNLCLSLYQLRTWKYDARSGWAGGDRSEVVQVELKGHTGWDERSGTVLTEGQGGVEMSHNGGGKGRGRLKT